MKPEPSKMILVWNLSDDAVFVDVSYEATDGKIKKLILPGDVAQTDLADWKKGGKIESVTYTLPEKNAVDTIRLDPAVQYFPTEVEYEVNKSNFSAVPLPTDSKGNGYDGKIEGIWDGVEGSEVSNRYHSSDGEGVLHHLTFDMGMYATNIRYIRYRVLEVFGPPSIGSGAYGCVQEISFWADDMKQINK